MKEIDRKSNYAQQVHPSIVEERWPPPRGIHLIVEKNNTREQVLELLRSLAESLPKQKKSLQEIIEDLE